MTSLELKSTSPSTVVSTPDLAVASPASHSMASVHAASRIGAHADLQGGVKVGLAVVGTMLIQSAFSTMWNLLEREVTVTAVFDSKDEAWRWSAFS